MVTVALLGTDRRDPPAPPAGGLADLAADDPQPTPSQRLLQQVAATHRRAPRGIAAGRASRNRCAAGRRPAPDHACSGNRHVATHRHRLAGAGRRVAAARDALSAAGWHPNWCRRCWLVTAPTPSATRGRSRLPGPLGEWMIDWSPRLACTAKQSPSARDARDGGGAAGTGRSCPSW